MHEASQHENNCFVTLTYSDDELPYSENLIYSHVQKFLKALRKRGHKVRFYAAGEYGELYGRPHWHLCLFGYKPTDLEFFKKTWNNDILYTSPSIDEAWFRRDRQGRNVNRGFATVGNLTHESAGYAARYCLKKITGELAHEHYEHVTRYGELVNRVPEFARMSLKPGIGHDWFERYRDDVFPRDEVIVNGRKVSPPRYYSALYEITHPDDFARVVQSRRAKAAENKRAGNLTPEKLEIRDVILKSRTQSLKRSLESTI